MRLNVVAALTGALVLTGASPAWAHATFRPVTADPGARLDTVLSVPPEPEGTNNTRITMYVAVGWTPLECRSPVGWDCALTPSDVTWTRLAGVASGEDFDVALTAPGTPGTYAFPVVQEVDDGSVHRWDSDARADGAAPQLAVRGAGVTPPPTTASPRPTASPRTTRTAAPTRAPLSLQTPLPQPSSPRPEAPSATVTAVPSSPPSLSATAAPVLGSSVVADRQLGMPELLAVLLLVAAGAAQVVSRVTRP